MTNEFTGEETTTEESLDNQNQNENQDNGGAENSSAGEETNADFEARLAKAEAEAAKFRRLYTKATKKAPSKEESTSEIDYAELAYLNSLGYKDQEVQQAIKEEAEATGKPLHEVVNFQYMQEKIEQIKTTKQNAEANVTGDKRGSNSAIDSVDYWINKGELPPADNVELRRKVVNEKIARAKNKTKFGTGNVEIR